MISSYDSTNTYKYNRLTDDTLEQSTATTSLHDSRNAWRWHSLNDSHDFSYFGTQYAEEIWLTLIFLFLTASLNGLI